MGRGEERGTDGWESGEMRMGKDERVFWEGDEGKRRRGLGWKRKGEGIVMNDGVG